MKRTLEKLKKGQHVTIVALGDSNTEITFHTRGRMNWVGLLSEAIFETYGNGVCTMINSGKCGSSFHEALTRLDRDVIRHKPDLVIAALGLNDASRGVVELERFKLEVRQAVQRIHQGCASEILIRTFNPLVNAAGIDLSDSYGPGCPFDRLDKAHEVYARTLVEFAKELDCAVVDHYSLWCRKQLEFHAPVSNPQRIWMRMGDAIHPGYEGHLAFFRELAPFFEVPTHFPWETVTESI